MNDLFDTPHPSGDAQLPAARRYNKALEAFPMPSRIRRLPINQEGWPELFFAATVDDYGRRDLRIADARKAELCIRSKLCWLCGDKLGRFMAFPIGPMCVVNRVTSEPPCHLECAQYAVQVCPFLTKPRMVRNKNDLPPEGVNPGGIMLERNPGVTCIYVTGGYKRFDAGNGKLIKLSEPPTTVEWWTQARKATRAEVLDAIESGCPDLERIARAEGRNARAALDALERSKAAAMKLLPAA